MKEEAREYYHFLLTVCQDENIPLVTVYRQLREFLERLCRTQMPDGSLQMTDLSARVSFVASKVGLSVVEQNRLHTFRLTSNAVLNRQSEPSRENLLRDIKTLTFFVKRLTGEDIPAELYHQLPRADATYIVAPPAKERIRRMRVCFQYADDTFLYVLPVDTVADEPLRVRYNVSQVNEEFAETCKLLWRHAQVNLLDVAVDEAGILTPSFIILEPDYLLDISSLAECFKDYGHHPANYLLARLQSPDNTRPLLLGNIANLFLDEWIYAKEEPDYLTCMKKAFRTYSIDLAACADLLDKEKEKEFFADCKRHFESQSHAEHQHHEVIYVGIQRNLVLNSRAQLIGGKKTQRQRIDHKIAQKYTEEEHHRTNAQGFLHATPLISIERRTDKPPDFKKNIRRSRHHRHPECSGHVNKERGSQINID